MISFVAHSQIHVQHEECDTINIDKCYMVIGEDRIAIDTNVGESVNGLFSFVNVEPLNPNYCMLYVTQTDTFYTVYDSTISNGLIVYLVDTSFSTKLYGILIENEEEFDSLVIKRLREYQSENEVDKTRGELMPLHLRRFYKYVASFPEQKNEFQNNNVSTTWSCEHCQVIILHSKEEKVYDCPLFNNLYRLK